MYSASNPRCRRPGCRRRAEMALHVEMLGHYPAVDILCVPDSFEALDLLKATQGVDVRLVELEPQ